MGVYDNDKLQFGIAESHEELIQVFSVSKDEWGKAMTPQGYLHHYTLEFERQREEGKNIKAFYIKDIESGVIVASCIVNPKPGFFKEADRSQAIASIPDPTSFGVKNVTGLHVEMVFVNKDYRGKGLGEAVVERSIEYVEKSLIDKELEASDVNAVDSFANMVKDSLGKVDSVLANYYLSKKYIWHLYSGVGDTFYSRFGFKKYPIPLYLMPFDSFTFMNETLDFLLKDSNKGQQSFPVVPGKLLQLLEAGNPQHQRIIESIYQSKELEIMMELNKTTFHLQLSGLLNSSSSLTNMNNILSYSKTHGGFGSSAAISEMAVFEDIEERSDTDSQTPTLRRKSSVMHSAVSKFAMKPDYLQFCNFAKGDTIIGRLKSELETLDEKKADTKSWNIQGAILTNELQRKSYYIIWQCLLGGSVFFILSMGEVSGDITGNGALSVLPFPNRRRGSSFTGLNDLGGINFQDLDILLSAAARVANLRQPLYSKAFFVSPNDLPTDIPVTVVHDYFMNYLSSKRTESSKPIEFHEDASKLCVLPMLKRFGDTSPTFDLDWIYSGMWSWA
ncbi:uncharacterized protein KQ657_004442 [Scheffersomyces spartinae]|uniref:N-acetyltransferase domain-containing protein n=1 Tax=Scheffersomyces spartinae TaxID=45513 RepID=A0A9P8AK43_9ASCO|nr:uncharacterized protein KQ657_004442 [Scheffersomyces spartinae]KAG7194762.1 hypothetical protein KQ657_004442 [Scheffersomyces spartinae]